MRNEKSKKSGKRDLVDKTGEYIVSRDEMKILGRSGTKPSEFKMQNKVYCIKGKDGVYMADGKPLNEKYAED